MSRYRRLKIESGAVFFTLALADCGSDLLVRHIERLRRAYAHMEKRHPFETVAICILPVSGNAAIGSTPSATTSILNGTLITSITTP